MAEQHRTKIVATLGPATDDPRVLRDCLRAGLDIARMNTAHGTGIEQRDRIRALREAVRELGRPAGVLVDLPGPKFRLGALPGGLRELRRGETVVLGPGKDVSENFLPVRDARILAAVGRGHLLHLADGLVTLEATGRRRDSVVCQVLVEGTVRSGSGINLPDSDVRVSIPTRADMRGIELAVSQKAEWIGVSFVRTAADIAGIRRALRRLGHAPRVVAKIEKPQALDNLDALLREADGVMVARGDLGVETPLARVPLVQKRIILKANEMGKPVITATQMLESMVEHGRPTRAEVTDVANAVLDGTDAVMLSAETAVGRHPVAAVRMLGEILAATETAYPFEHIMEGRSRKSWPSPEDAVSHASCRLAWDVGARAIVVASQSPTLPYRISCFRPPMPVLALTRDGVALGQLSLSWGVRPLFAGSRGGDPLNAARRWLLRERVARRGDRIVWVHSIDRRAVSAGDAVELATL